MARVDDEVVVKRCKKEEIVPTDVCDARLYSRPHCTLAAVDGVEHLQVWLCGLPHAAQALLTKQLLRSKENEKTYADLLKDYPEQLWIKCMRQLLGGPARKELDDAIHVLPKESTSSGCPIVACYQR